VRRRTASAAARQRRRSLASAASTSLLCLALIILAVPAAGLASGRWQFVPVRSGSMQPALPAGSLALAVRTSLSSVKRGDVIVYRIPIGDHHLTAHRVVRVLRGGPHPVVQTKGDSNAQDDPWLARLNGPTAWKVKTSVPLLGYAALHLSDPRLGLLLLTLATLAGLAAALRALWRRRPLPAVLLADTARLTERPAVATRVRKPTTTSQPKAGDHRLALCALALTVVGGLALHALRQRGGAPVAQRHVAARP
jgi:signal peptidase